MKMTEISGLNDSVFGKCVAPLAKMVEAHAEAWEEKSFLPMVFAMGTSESWGERSSGMSGIDNAKPVGENGSYPLSDWAEGYAKEFVHMTFKNSVGFSREIVDDNQYMQMEKKCKALVNSMYRARELFGAAIFGEAIKGNTSFTFEGHKFLNGSASADGKCIFATDHLSKGGKGTQSNKFSDTFSMDALGAVQARMKLFKDDNGILLNVAPCRIIIPVGDAALTKAVYQAVGSGGDPDTANNAANPQRQRWEIVNWAYLDQFITAGTAPWIVMDPDFNEEADGAQWYDRVEPEFGMEKQHNDSMLHTVYARWSAGVGNWRGMAVGGVTGGTDLTS